MALKLTNSGTQCDYVSWKREKMAAANRATARGEVKLDDKFKSQRQHDIAKLRQVINLTASTWIIREVLHWKVAYYFEIEDLLNISYAKK